MQNFPILLLTVKKILEEGGNLQLTVELTVEFLWSFCDFNDHNGSCGIVYLLHCLDIKVYLHVFLRLALQLVN